MAENDRIVLAACSQCGRVPLAVMPGANRQLLDLQRVGDERCVESSAKQGSCCGQEPSGPGG